MVRAGRSTRRVPRPLRCPLRCGASSPASLLTPSGRSPFLPFSSLRRSATRNQLQYFREPARLHLWNFVAYGFSPHEAPACDVSLDSQRHKPGFDARDRDVLPVQELRPLIQRERDQFGPDSPSPGAERDRWWAAVDSGNPAPSPAGQPRPPANGHSRPSFPTARFRNDGPKDLRLSTIHPKSLRTSAPIPNNDSSRSKAASMVSAAASGSVRPSGKAVGTGTPPGQLRRIVQRRSRRVGPRRVA